MQGRILLHFAIFLLLQLLFSSCASYRHPTCHYDQPLTDCPKHKQNLKTATRSPLYRYIPRHRCQIQWYDVPHWTSWALFGNDDDGIFGEAQCDPYQLHRCNGCGKALCWWIRNPFHNLFHYVLGSAHCVNSEFTLLNLNECGIQTMCYSPVARHNYGGRGTSFFLALHGWKPFVSMRLVYFNKYQTDFYLGWRKHGAFGFKLQPFKSRERDL